MLRHLFKTGNSVVVSLPKEILEELHLADGGTVSLDFERENQRIIITPVSEPLVDAGVDAEFALQVKEFIEKYRPALEELSR